MRNTKKVIAATAAVATLVGLAACGSSNDNGANKGDADKAELVFWGWDSGNSMKEILADFEKANPGITVKFNNTGTAEKTSTALSNAIAAGNGAPDVVMLEDPTVTQFAVTGDLADLSQFGADKLADDFSAGPWSKLQYDGKPYALPIDSGPEVFFYNDAVLKKAGVDGSQIKTWDDYYEAAKKVKAIGAYMTNNSGSSMEYQPFTAQAWQAGAQPWKVDGENITNLPSHLIMRKGIAISPEGRRIFPALTVVENLQMGGFFQSKDAIAEGMEYAFKLFPRLKDRANQRAGTMSGGEQQMLAIARALMSEPVLLMLDEPSLGLAPKIVGELFGIIKQLREENMTVLLVEQNATAALAIADRAYVLENGRITLSGAAREMLTNPEIKRMYLGG